MARIISVGKHFVEIGLDDGSIINVEKQKLDFTFKKGDTVEIYGEKDNPKIMPTNYIKKDTPAMQFLKAIIIVVALVFVYVMVKSIVSGLSDSFNSNNNEQEIINDSPIAKKGEILNVGDLSYVVKSVRITDEVGNTFLSQKAKGIYLVIEITITNNGDESITILDSFFKLLYGKKTYDADSTASLYVSMENDGDSIWFDELNPDLSLTGKIAFDVTEEVANSNDIKLQIQTDFWGWQTGTVEFN